MSPEVIEIRDDPSPWWTRPLPWVELFVVSNIAFLTVDIYVAHSINRFAEPAEWVPFAYSAVSPVILVLAMLLAGQISPSQAQDSGPGANRRRVARWMGLLVGWGGVIVGIAGLLFHLDAQFFREQTLHNLVYTAPFTAPLAYAGLGLLLIMNRMVDSRSVEWARWILMMALGGFIGNFALSLTDHAQNGFFYPAEWISVIASAYAVSGLLAMFLVYDNRPLQWLVGVVLLAQIFVGLLGFYYHAAAVYRRPMETLWEKVLYGAPIFAPLLFADIAVLGLLGLWGLAWTQSQQRKRPS
ncbi:hypothetical protein BH23PLA1_BH23PLA1_14760 [soil metagenome]